MVLYPNDSTESGKELRLRQQYFLASASLQDVIRQWVRVNGEDFSRFAEKNCFQLASVGSGEMLKVVCVQKDT